MFRDWYSPGTELSNSFDSLDSRSGSMSEGERDDFQVTKLEETTYPSFQQAPFPVHYLGMIEEVNLGARTSRDPDVQLIDKLEEGQLEGKISMVAKDEDLVSLLVSKHGIRISDESNTEVRQRHPLHTVAQVVYYTDSFFKSNIAFKIGQVGRTVFDCYVFQCTNESQAQNICEAVKGVFELITGR